MIVGSVHVDPRAGWFPHFLGFAHGLGAKNIPLAPGTADEEWLEAVRSLVQWARESGVQGLVVSLGVDAAAGDPESPLEVTQDGYREAGAIVGGLGVPTVIVQEGGYDLETIGPPCSRRCSASRKRVRFDRTICDASSSARVVPLAARLRVAGTPRSEATAFIAKEMRDPA